jgi:hypothetical protein
MEDRKIGSRAIIPDRLGLTTRILPLFFCLPFFCPTSSLALDSSDLALSHAEVGFGGKFRSGFWTPVSFTLLIGSGKIHGDLQIVSQDGDNVPVGFFAVDGSPQNLAIHPPAGKGTDDQTYHTYVKIGPHHSRLSLQLVDPQSRKILWQTLLSKVPDPLPATTPLILTIGQPVGVGDALKFTRQNVADAPVAADVKTGAELPEHWWGYEGVDTVFLPTGTAGILNQINPQQAAAIEQWVAQGGRLVLSAGGQAEKLSAASHWKAFVPGQIQEISPMRDAATLEALAGEAFPFTDDASRPLVARLASVRGKVILAQGPRAADIPLIVRSHYGLGEVLFVAFDLESEPFAKWRGRPRFVASLLREQKNALEQPGGAAATRLGYTDLTGQLRGALDQFPGVQVVNITTVALLIGAYISLIGPLDFFLWQRLKVSRTFTWVSFSLLAVAFCGVAWFLAGWSRGSALRLNQAEIVDIDAERGTVRGTAWLHLYSPATKAYDLGVQPQIAAKVNSGTAGGHLAWQGLPGSGLGGLNAKRSGFGMVSPYEIEFPSGVPGIRSLPIQTGSSKSLAARWWGEVSFPSSSQIKLNEHGVPTGDVVNPLDVELTDCIFTFNIWMYRLKKLGPGERFSLSDARPLYLESRLQEHTASDFKDSATPWIRDATDVPAILQMLMYHDAAKGQIYTGLTHRYQSHLDMSSQLASRGLLVGRAARPASELQVDGASLHADQIQNWTYYRIVIPIGEYRGGAAP